MANGGEQPELPASVTGTRQKPQVTVTMPHDRHFPGRLGRRIDARPGDKNTMIEPWVDVRADIDAINHGEAIVDQSKATAWINSRLYGFHTGTGSTGKLFPMWGRGLIPMDQKQIRALEKVITMGSTNDPSGFSR